MATSRSRRSTFGGPCLKVAAVVWGLGLCASLIVLNQALAPIAEEEGGGGPGSGGFARFARQLRASERAQLERLARAARAAAPHAGQPAPGAAPPAGGAAAAAAPERQQPGEGSAGAEAANPFEADPDNNAPRPPPRPGEHEVKSEAPNVLPGADEEHMHGRLGLREDGSLRIAPTPLPPGGLSTEERRDAHRGFCFNSRKSDSLPLDRFQKDQRSAKCRQKSKSYPADLPVASVVIIFFNENLSILLRSVHSVLNRTPPRLLKEIILVDDASSADPDRFYERHWERLQDELTDYVRHLPKVRLVRLKERRGLMLARMEGIWRATAEVTVFLDSHIEATTGWLEPLLARIKEDPRHVVVPRIDDVGYESFEYTQGGGLGAMSFSWGLKQEGASADTGPDGTEPAKSAIMCGGLFATDTRMFLRLGGYDPGMRLYEGEEVEIGFRTWMCGGDIEWVPCSHVGHVFRSGKYWQGQVYRVPGEEISRNRLRTAEVWMDDYKQLVKYAVAPLPKDLPVGDLEPRRRLREKLQCKSFDWYLKTVVPKKFVPHLTADARAGALQNPLLKGCVDTLGHDSSGGEMGVYPCHGQHGTQAMVMDGNGLVRLPQTNYALCMAADAPRLTIRHCSEHDEKSRWRWDPSTHAVALVSDSGSCLEAVKEEVPGSPYKLQLSPCTEGSKRQEWIWTA